MQGNSKCYNIQSVVDVNSDNKYTIIHYNHASVEVQNTLCTHCQQVGAWARRAPYFWHDLSIALSAINFGLGMRSFKRLNI